MKIKVKHNKDSNNSRNLVFTRLQSINCLKNIEENGSCYQKCGSRTGKSTDASVIKMFDHFTYGKPKWVTKPSENLK